MKKYAKLTQSELYARIASRVVEAMEQGVDPWRKPWVAGSGTAAGGPTSISTGQPYRGGNQWYLHLCQQLAGHQHPLWGTYRAIKAAGGQVRRGESAEYIWHFKQVVTEKKNAQTGEAEKSVFPLLQTFAVFNVAQADWEAGKLEALLAKHGGGEQPEQPEQVWESDKVAEGIAARYIGSGGPVVRFGGDRACFIPALDRVQMPERGKFRDGAGYYSTLFHELTHSTGHKDRLDRLTAGKFGSGPYAREELVAEFGACFLCGEAGITDRGQRDNSAAYLANWAEALKKDPKALVWAIGRASKAADLIMGRKEATAATEEA